MNRAKKITVLGFGKIGQALAAGILSAHKAISVLGVDVNTKLLRNFDTRTFQSSEPDVGEVLTHAFSEKRLTLSSRCESIPSSEAVLIAIPLLVNRAKRIEEKTFLTAMKRLAPYLSDGCVVSIETSVPVGFLRGKILPVLEAEGKRHGKDFFLVHSPERIKSGTMLRQLAQNEKIIGGVDDEACQKAESVYSRFLDPSQIKRVPSAETAEMIKLAGMVYRDINIALANELAKYSAVQGIDIKEVIRFANTDGEAGLLEPGIGVGGHCTPVYPYFLIEGFRKVGMEFHLALEGRKVNDGMAAEVAERLHKKGVRKVLILGLGFRSEVKEDSFSTSYLLHRVLRQNRINAVLNDPLYSLNEIKDKGFHPHRDIYCKTPEAVILVTCHNSYRQLRWPDLYKGGCRIFVDGRNVFDPATVQRSGIEYLGIGR